MTKFKSILVLLLCGFTLNCAKDKTLDEYRDEKNQKDLAKFRAIEGTYTGLVRFVATGEAVFALEIKLTAGKSESEGMVLKSVIEFMDSRPLKLGSLVSEYAEASGFYHVDISHNFEKSQTTEEISIRGNIIDGRITARILGGRGREAEFTLYKDGKPLETVAKEAGLDQKGTDVTVEHTFKGRSNFMPDDPKEGRKIELSVQNPNRAGVLEVFKTFIPEAIQLLQMSVKFDPEHNGTTVVFPEAEWDPRTGQVKAETTLGGPNVVIQKMLCWNFYFLDTKKRF